MLVFSSQGMHEARGGAAREGGDGEADRGPQEVQHIEVRVRGEGRAGTFSCTNSISTTTTMRQRSMYS